MGVPRPLRHRDPRPPPREVRTTYDQWRYELLKPSPFLALPSHHRSVKSSISNCSETLAAALKAYDDEEFDQTPTAKGYTRVRALFVLLKHWVSLVARVCMRTVRLRYNQSRAHFLDGTRGSRPTLQAFRRVRRYTVVSLNQSWTLPGFTRDRERSRYAPRA